MGRSGMSDRRGLCGNEMGSRDGLCPGRVGMGGRTRVAPCWVGMGSQLWDEDERDGTGLSVWGDSKRGWVERPSRTGRVSSGLEREVGWGGTDVWRAV